MIDPESVPTITDDEMLARFVFNRRHLRADKTVKQDAFIPDPHFDLSVTRRLMASEPEIWSVGESIAKGRRISLIGSADTNVAVCHRQSLSVVADPIQANPNHALILGWPSEKERRKLIAAEIAAVSTFRIVPNSSS